MASQRTHANVIQLEDSDDEVIFVEEKKGTSQGPSSSKDKTETLAAVIAIGLPKEDVTRRAIEIGLKDVFEGYPLAEIVFNKQRKYQGRCRIIFYRTLTRNEYDMLINPKSGFNRTCLIKNVNGIYKQNQLRFEPVKDKKMIAECEKLMEAHKKLNENTTDTINKEETKFMRKLHLEYRTENNKKRRLERQVEEEERLKKIRMEKHEAEELRKTGNIMSRSSHYTVPRVQIGDSGTNKRKTGSAEGMSGAKRMRREQCTTASQNAGSKSPNPLLSASAASSDLTLLYTPLTSSSNIDPKSTVNNGTYLVLDSVFYNPGDKPNFYKQMLEVILLDGSKNVLKLVAYQELAVKFRFLTQGTVININNFSCHDDNFVKYIGSSVPYSLLANLNTEVNIDQNLSRQWQQYFADLLKENVSSEVVKDFHGFVLNLKVTHVTFPKPIMIRGEHGFVATVSCITNDSKTVNFAFFNEHITQFPLLIITKDYVISHSHVKEHSGQYADIEMSITQKTTFVPLDDTLENSHFSFEELKNMTNLPNLINTELFLLAVPKLTSSAGIFNSYTVIVTDSSGSGPDVITAVLNLITIRSDPAWKVGFSLKGTFEIHVDEHMVKIRAFDKFTESGDKAFLSNLIYKQHEFMYR
ncbi:hypothetical protein QR680_011758 [Steinernema hermaphroditum]|uniref:Uncharacterized protein n=1 Tax=Steinernema hermaphroditum TaxID=289476 RepID=A0AA39LZJ2_9BILA|nr:hypothetical protein QR680_011758 [Steinernema hermaphroditum]